MAGHRFGYFFILCFAITKTYWCLEEPATLKSDVLARTVLRRSWLGGVLNSGFNSLRNTTRIQQVLDRNPTMSATLEQAVRNNTVNALQQMVTESGFANEVVINAVDVFVRGIVDNSVNLSGVLAYLPQLVLMDLPTQFTRMSEILRADGIPLEQRNALDIISTFIQSSRDVGIQDRLFGPISSFLPTIVQGLGTFLSGVLTEAFTFAG